MKKTIEIKKEIAEHTPSGFLLVNGIWECDPSDEYKLTHGQKDYTRVTNIIYDDDPDYIADDPDQDHEEDYTINEYTFTVTYEDDGTDEEYENDKDNYESGRDEYYGWSMNGGGKKEFQKMYGDGNYDSFVEWLVENKECEIECK